MTTYAEIRHFHFFCGLGGGAKGFNQGQARVGNLHAKFRCIGGIDVDKAAIRDFDRIAGARGTVLDLFTREQYRIFHGQEPPDDWREATITDIHNAAGNEVPHIVFLSPPCKGFSGLLSETKSKSAKYQALNGLVLRGLFLMLEAWKDDPIALILLENVPRIATRGRSLLDRITGLLRAYGYATAETTHDCGELGGLAQSRKRFLYVARHEEKIPSFLYEPLKRPLRPVGDILSRMPRPGDPLAGPMHRIPRLQWKTWVRLALVEAGSDWRSLNRLVVENGFLRDYGIVPEQIWRDGTLGVLPWDAHTGAITGNAGPATGRFNVADVRAETAMRGDCLGVMGYNQSAGTVTSRGYPMNGRFSIADPSHISGQYGKYTVTPYDEATGTVIAGSSKGEGAFAIADPTHLSGQYGKYFVTPHDSATGTVISGSTTGQGAFALADPKPDWMQSKRKHEAYEHIYRVVSFDAESKAITGASHTAGGALSVADPLPGLNRSKGDHYLTAGQYGVRRWQEPSGSVSASACHDNGFFSIADPLPLPALTDNLVCCIIAPDKTWHRPFTTLELAALQSLLDPEDYFELDGSSDSAWRERIGNAVPPRAAAAIAGAMGEVLLLTWSGQTFAMSYTPIWVRPVTAALMAATSS